MSKQSIVGVYTTHTAAEAAVQKLHKAAFDMKTISILGKGYHSDEHVVGYYNAGDRVAFWGKTGAFWGAMWGLLFGSALLVLPGIGPLFVLGPMGAAIVGALEGAAVGGAAGAFGAAMYGIGIPSDSVLKYTTAIKADKFLVVVHDTGDKVTQARDVLHGAGAVETNLHIGE